MRLVDVHVESSRPIDLVLHPRLTVVTGDPVAAGRLAEVLARAFVLAGHDITGTVEYSGFHTPLDQIGVVSLDLQGEGFRVLDALDLPRPDQRHREQLLDELVDGQHRWEAVVQELAAEVAQLARRAGATGAAARVGREELEATRNRRASLEAELAAARDRPSRIGGELAALREMEPEVSARLEQATAVESALVAQLSPSGGAVSALRMGDDVAAQLELLGTGERLGLVQPATAAAVSKWLQRLRKGTADPDPAVAGMLEEVRDLEQQWERVSAIGVEDEPAVREARQRHDALVSRRNALEELSASGILVERARSEIDAAHAERLRVEAERHRHGGGVERAIADEHTVCSRYGFDSYLDYTIALSTRSVGDAVQATLDRVRTEVVGAADALEAVREQAASARHVLTQRRAEAREHLRAQIGHDADSLSVEALRRIPALPAELAGIEAQAHAGVAAVAAEQSRTAADEVALGEELAGLEARAVELEAVLAAEASAGDRLASLVARAEAGHVEVEAALGDAQARSQAASTELAACVQQLSELANPTGNGYGAADIPMVISHVAPLVDPPGPDPVPVLMLDTFAPLGEHRVAALEATLVASVRVQIVYLTDDPEIIRWADQLTPSAGQVVRLPRPGWFQRRLARRSGHVAGVHERH